MKTPARKVGLESRRVQEPRGKKISGCKECSSVATLIFSRGRKVPGELVGSLMMMMRMTALQLPTQGEIAPPLPTLAADGEAGNRLPRQRRLSTLMILLEVSRKCSTRGPVEGESSVHKVAYLASPLLPLRRHRRSRGPLRMGRSLARQTLWARGSKWRAFPPTQLPQCQRGALVSFLLSNRVKGVQRGTPKARSGWTFLPREAP
mmetsp:Transcript_10656/g.21918  ORF Transcript_10656/g.21918 Transcript_10656/m.21918 type:complete len:205 (-) Transcript_10656:136-750(-)